MSKFHPRLFSNQKSSLMSMSKLFFASWFSLCLQRSPYKMSCMGLLIPIHHSKRGCSISMIRYREWKRKNPSGFSRFHICQYLCNWAKQQTKTFLYQPNYAMPYTMVLGGVRVVVCTWKRSLRVAGYLREPGMESLIKNWQLWWIGGEIAAASREEVNAVDKQYHLGSISS